MLPRTQSLALPGLVRIKPGALDRLGVYLARSEQRRVAVLTSAGLLPELGQRLEASLAQAGISLAAREEVHEASFESAAALFTRLPSGCQALIGLGGGKALDVAKYVAFLAGLPYLAVPVNDFAALLSDATVFQFMARPTRDLEGVRLLATALMLNGVAMEVSGSSRPASGSEHLLSHALDALSVRPRLHGLQVGVATYLVSRLQGQGTERIASVLDATGFWRGIAADPFSRGEWLEAVRLAPTLKEDFHTVLSSRDCAPEVAELLRTDARLVACFVG